MACTRLDPADGYSSAILVRTSRVCVPATIYVIEPALHVSPSAAVDDEIALAGNPIFNAHGMQPDVVLGMLGMVGTEAKHVLVVGCEPASVDYGIGLSEPVAAAVDEAVKVVLDLVSGAAQSGEDHRLVTKEWAHVPRDSG